MGKPVMALDSDVKNLKRIQNKEDRKGIAFPRYFTAGLAPGKTPYDEVQWETRTAAIGNDKGAVIFEQRDVEVPADWSQTATNIVVSKYFHGKMGTPQRETSVRQLIGRVVNTIADWGAEQHYFRTPEDAAIVACFFKAAGADVIDCSSGQVTKAEQPVYGRMYHVPFSDRIRNEVGVPTIAVGNIFEGDHVNTIVAAGRADLCAVARPHLADPAWTLHDFRRTIVSTLARKPFRFNPVVLDKLLGHQPTTLTPVARIYAQEEHADLRREALAAWGRFLTQPPAEVVDLARKRGRTAR